MKKIISVLVLCMCLFSAHAVENDIAAAKALVHRLLPQWEDKIQFRLLSQGGDAFELQTVKGKLMISGNDANSMAVGLNHYLKYYCHVEIGWLKNDTYTIPSTMPSVPKTIKIKARVKDRFFLNYCTFGYTMPWWKWDEWEHFIDWMALNGINLPLAITGQESIWYKVWKDYGLTDKEVRSYFTGPAHLPWHRMLNIDYWGGPLPKSWLDGQLELQKKITARERELNMRPVLPAFAGHVPHELTRIFPKAKITKLEAWSGYPDQYACSFLDPMDPLFKEIQKKFIDTEASIYGTDHVYGIDLFNELTPPSWEPEYLGRVSRQVYESLADADKDAIWLQMTWLFYNDHDKWTLDRVKPYITSYPANHSLLLDYFCERHEVWQETNKYYGVPYIWCYLGNFGGNTALVGNVADVNKRIENTFKNGGKNFVGLGATLEGFDCNPFMYEYVFEKAWDFKTHRNIPQWTDLLADQRTGKYDPNARKAWQILVDSVYCSTTSPGQCPLINVRPCFGKYRSYYANTRIKYHTANLVRALGLLLKVNSTTHSYEFDVANLARQMMSDYFKTVFEEYQNAYEKRDRSAMKQLQKEMMQIIKDVNRTVQTQSYFLMGKWIKDARSWGNSPMEKLYYEQNARNLLTTWSDKDQLLNDYASRTWAGLTDSFYGKRWSMFFQAVNQALDRGETFDEDHYQVYKAKVTTFEKYWWEECVGKFPSKPVGNSKQVALEMYNKYASKIVK